MTIEGDRYTKAVLTVIALCLVFQCAMLVGQRVDAQAAGQPAGQPAVQPVVVVGWGDMLPDRHVRMAPPQTPFPVAIAAPHALPVVVDALSRPIPVAIASIHHGGGPWDTITTRLEPQAPSPTPGYPKP
jgi:hypothetical protein